MLSHLRMIKRPLVGVIFVGCLISVIGVAGVVAIGQERKVRKVTRVNRPTFTDADWQSLYFADINEALIGERPAALEAPIELAGNDANSSSADANRKFAWSEYVSAVTIEDEVKSLVQKLNVDLTTPVKFKTSYIDVNQTFSELALCFALIQDFDADVRWKDSSANAFAAVQRATVSSRSSTDQSYAYCNSRKFELTDLVRGESFGEIEKPSDTVDWSDVIDRSPAMVRLEVSDNQLKEWTANQSVFESNVDKILHEAEWVAAIAEVIAKEGMSDADDDGYVEFCKSMGAAARETVEAVKTNDFEKASKYANLMSQSCSNCHEEWRARP